MKASTIERELRRVKEIMGRECCSNDDQQALYGAMQALSWALGRDTARPSLLGREPDESVCSACHGDGVILNYGNEEECLTCTEPDESEG